MSCGGRLKLNARRCWRLRRWWLWSRLRPALVSSDSPRRSCCSEEDDRWCNISSLALEPMALFSLFGSLFRNGSRRNPVPLFQGFELLLRELGTDLYQLLLDLRNAGSLACNFCKHAAQELRQLRRSGGKNAQQGRCLCLQNLCSYSLLVPHKGKLSGQTLEQHHAKGVYVAVRVDRSGIQLLR